MVEKHSQYNSNRAHTNTMRKLEYVARPKANEILLALTHTTNKETHKKFQVDISLNNS